MLLRLYAAAAPAHREVKASGDAVIDSTSTHRETILLGMYADSHLALDALLMADARRTCFHEGRGWWAVPDDLEHELWARPTGRPAGVVARIADNTLTLAGDFAVTLPGHDPQPTIDTFSVRYRLITGHEPIRTPRLTHVTTPGGHLPAEGA